MIISTHTYAELDDLVDHIIESNEINKRKSERFEKCVERKLMKDGSIEIHCTRGLWAVFSMDHYKAEMEAQHYWSQYDSDGEYLNLT